MDPFVAVRGTDTVCGLTGSSGVTCWPGLPSLPMTQVQNLSSVVDVAPGADLQVAVERDGTLAVWSWGGDLAAGPVDSGCRFPYDTFARPFAVVPDVTHVANGLNAFCVLHESGTVESRPQSLGSTRGSHR